MATFVGVLPLAARTTDQVSKTFENNVGERGLHLVVDLETGSPGIVVAINGVDAYSQKSYNILTSPNINASGLTVMKVGPEYTAATNVAKDYLPFHWNVTVTASGAQSGSYSIGASVI